MEDDRMYVAVIGDIVGSRKLEDRGKYQQRLKETLSSINVRYSDDIISHFMITLGDEFQGLLAKGRNVLKIIQEIEEKMEPLSLRFGIGIGRISTAIEIDSSIEIDGPAYHYAREMIIEVERKSAQSGQILCNMMVSSGPQMITEDTLLNTILSLCTALKSKWTDRQKEIIYMYRFKKGNQINTGQALGIGQTSVHRSLYGARYFTYATSMEAVNAIIKTRMGDK